MKGLITGDLLYGWKWHRESIRKFHEAVTTSGADPESLLHLALEHWSYGPTPDTVATLHFGMVVHTLSSLAGRRNLCSEFLGQHQFSSALSLLQLNVIMNSCFHFNL